MNLVINNIEVTSNEDGLYSLADLWRGASNKRAKSPSEWMRYDSFASKVTYLELYFESLCSTGNPVQQKQQVISKNEHGYTYVCKELVYSYAMWISDKYHFEVITAFDNLVNGRIIEAIELAKDSVKIRLVKSELDKLVDNELENNIESTHKLANIIGIYQKHSSSTGSALASCRGVKGKIAEVETKLTNRNQYGMNL